jgi:hypothetical protein
MFCETLRVELEAWGFFVECFDSEEAAVTRFVNNCLEPRPHGYVVGPVPCGVYTLSVEGEATELMTAEMGQQQVPSGLCQFRL